MSKPEWNEDTPKWANWLAQDEDGEWWWYEMKPKLRFGFKAWVETSRNGKLDPASGRMTSGKNEYWENTLEPRP